MFAKVLNGGKDYFRNAMNVFEFIIIWVSIVEVILQYETAGDSLNGNPNDQYYRLMKSVKSLLFYRCFIYYDFTT